VTDVSVPVPADLTGVCSTVFGERLPLARRYAELLAGEGIEWGLIGPRETERIWERHILNSVCVSPLIDDGLRVADIGSGAGLPGIPLAIARPDLSVCLVEPMERRVDFLNLCVSELGLGDTVSVVRSRVEEYHGVVDVVVCRAVSSVTSLVGMTAGLVGPAVLLAIKGDRAPVEISDAAGELRRRRLTASVERVAVDGMVVGTVVRIAER